MKAKSLVFILLIPCFSAFAQDQKIAFGIGPEWNMNSRENFAGAAALSFDYNLPGSFALGVNFGASYNFTNTAVLEPAALFRWYFRGGAKGGGDSGLFAQADLGAYLAIEDGELTPLFLGGLRAGFRLPLGSSFYIEPYGRAGYPFMFGVGVLAGMKGKKLGMRNEE